MGNPASEAKTTILTPNDLEIVLVRDFQAPKELVFELWTKPEHVRRWACCQGMTIPECEIDFRVGGKWRWLMQMDGGGGGELSGAFEEIVRGERIVFSERWAPVPGSDHLVTVNFTERSRVTTMTQTYHHRSKVNRDGHLQSGMEQHVQHSHDMMQSLAQSLAQTRAIRLDASP